MAKHAHRLMLNQKKTWRCTLPGCSFFVHLGLAYILPGKRAICWECGEDFTLSERALQDDMPKCDDCRRASVGGPSLAELNEIVEAKLRNPIKKPINQPVESSNQEVDEVEVYEPDDESPANHAADCGIWRLNPCDCKS